MSDAELAAQTLPQLRGRMGIVVADYDDLYLTKFLKARNFNVDKAQIMLDDHLKWKAATRLDRVLDECFGSDIPQWYPSGFFGRDKEGHPIYIERPGKSKPKEIFAKHSVDFLIRWHLCIMETGRKKYRESGAPGITVIMDADGMGTSHLDMRALKFCKASAGIDQNNYPEHLAYCFIINAGMIFTSGWKLVSPFLDERTKKKVKIMNKDYKATLLEHIDADQLPKFLGGTAPDDAWCGKPFGSTDPSHVPLCDLATDKDSEPEPGVVLPPPEELGQE